MKKIGVVLLAITLVAGMAGCFTPFRMQYQLTISSTEGGNVTTPGEGTFTYWGGTVVNLVAEANEGYRFVDWTINACECNIADINAGSTTVTMNNDYSIIANFMGIPARPQQLAINCTEGGNVTTPGVGVFIYNTGMVVNLVAEADEGYQFMEWTGNVSTIADVTAAATNITMNGNYNITANFSSMYGDYSDLLSHVITSQGEITLGPGTEVNPSEGEHAPVEYYSGSWPTLEEFSNWYLGDINDEAPYSSDIIDLSGVDIIIGPLYRDGTLEIINTNNTPAILTLNGTVYVTGDVIIGMIDKDFILDLNGQSIFVESNPADPQKALWIGGKCTVVGSGAIISVGDMYFGSNTEVGVTDPVFLMSVLGTTSLQPAGDFYGAIAGSISVEIYLQPGASLNWLATEGCDINLPGCIL